MTTRNSVTGDLIKTKVNSQNFRDRWDLVFSKKDATNEEDSNDEVYDQWQIDAENKRRLEDMQCE